VREGNRDGEEWRGTDTNSSGGSRDKTNTAQQKFKQQCDNETVVTFE